MKSLAIIGFAVGTMLAGCASTSGARSEPTTGAASAPAHQHDHGDGDKPGMMARMCPMKVPGTTAAATEVDGGIGLSFTTTTGDVAELRQRVGRMAEKHNQPGGHRMMGSHGTAAPGAGAEHPHGAKAGARHDGGGRGGMMKGGRMMMPAATASVEDIAGGARLILQPKDPAQLGALREHVRMKAQRMAAGECSMMSLGSVGEPAPANPGDADTKLTTRRSKSVGSDDLAQVAEASTSGRVETLLIDADRQIAGRLDSATGRVELANLSDPHIDDLLDDLGELVAKKGGTVLVIPSAGMPSRTGLAAMYRY